MIPSLCKQFLIMICWALLATHCTSFKARSMITRLPILANTGRKPVIVESGSCTHVDQVLFSVDATSGENSGALIKLPILQIIIGSEITGEFICGNDLPGSVDKFQATLTSLEKQTTSDPGFKSGNYGVRNIYSEDQLENELSTKENYVILKLFREGCKKCALLDPVIDDLSRDPLYSKFIFLQAEVVNVNNYILSLKERLSGVKVGEKNIENCATCANTGFTECTICEGKGYVKKGELAAFCPNCTGYKKVKCVTCGGKCFKCS